MKVRKYSGSTKVHVRNEVLPEVRKYKVPSKVYIEYFRKYNVVHAHVRVLPEVFSKIFSKVSYSTRIRTVRVHIFRKYFRSSVLRFVRK